MNAEPNPPIDWQERKQIALRVAALLPSDRDAVASILGMVEDLLLWRDDSRPSQAKKAN